MKRRSLFLAILTAALLTTTASVHAASLNLGLVKKVTGNYLISLGPLCPVNISECVIYSNPSTSFTQKLTVSKKGIISGVWGKNDGVGNLDPVESDVTFTGKIKKVSQKGKITTATFSATGSDGSTMTGTIKNKKMAAYSSYTFDAKISLTTSAGAVKGSIIGIRSN